MATYIPKVVRKTLDDMISHVCDEDEGKRIAGIELEVEHEDGTASDVTILIMHGEWYEFLMAQAIDKFSFSDFLPKGWEGAA